MKTRLVIVSVVLAVWGGAITARLFQLQVRDHEAYRERAEGQHHRRVELQPPRGTIFDSRGRELAISVDVDSVWADPSSISDPKATARALAEVLHLDIGKIEQALVQDREFVWIARQLDPPVARAVRELDLRGVGFLKESKRYYPMRETASQLIGFAGLDSKGLEGLEQTYNHLVAGRAAERKVLRDARRGTVLLPSLSFQEPEPGSDVYLTIDAWIQYLLEKELQRVVQGTRARGATGVLLDPNTGAVLAMASYPTFDPNRFNESSRATWRNRVVTDAFEPGSTFKMITAAAALGAGLVHPEDRFDCENGSIVVRGVRIHDHKSFGQLAFREIIAKSSNVGAIKTGLLVGDERLYEQTIAFGFGRATGVDLPGESAGILRPVGSWPKRAGAYISFGQNISVTALQMANAFAAVANGGVLYRPYVVAAVGRPNALESLHTAPEVLGHPIDGTTAATLERLLEGVVSDGTGTRAAIDGYRVAGKTGTAQKASPEGGYADGRFVASFVGFAPARRPKIVAMIAVDEPVPSLGYHGGDVAAPVFSAVVGPALLYLGVAPEREIPDIWPGEQIALVSPEPEAAPAGPSPEPVLSSDRETDGFPDFSGLTAREAVLRSARMGLRAGLHGKGRVNRQVPTPGSQVDAALTEVELWLAEDSVR